MMNGTDPDPDEAYRAQREAELDDQLVAELLAQLPDLDPPF